MSRRSATVSGLVAVLAVAAVVFVAMSERVHPFTESLQREDSLDEDVRGNSSGVLLRFFNDDGSVTLDSDVRVFEMDAQMYGVSVRTSHTDGEKTHLDSIGLTLDAGAPSVPEIALKAPSGHPWEPIHFRASNDGRGAQLDVPDLGFQGSGTVVLDFVVGPYQQGEVPESIWLDFNARLHQEGPIQLTAHQAESLVEVPMPGREQATEKTDPAHDQ